MDKLDTERWIVTTFEMHMLIILSHYLVCPRYFKLLMSLQSLYEDTQLQFLVDKLMLVNVVPAKALMPTMLVQEHKDKTITHTVHEVLTWFGQPCLRPWMRENNSTIQ